MTDLQLFNFEGVEVRTVVKDGVVWFVAKDLCDVLDIQNVSDALKRLDEEERARFNLGRQGETNIINESGLYALVLTSRKPEARLFKKWVTCIVLPSIRKHGMYLTQNVLDMALTNPDMMIALLQNYKEEQRKREIAEGTVKLLMHTKKTFTTSELAKEIGFKSAAALNDELHQRGVQFKLHGKGPWLLYSEHANKGYTEIKQTINKKGLPIYYARWTQLGREFLLRQFQA